MPRIAFPMKKLLSTSATVFLTSVPLHYLWEVAQMPLYVESGSWLQFALHCIVPSLGDGLIMLMILCTGILVFRSGDWFIQPGPAGYAVMLIAGLLISVIVEWGAVYVLGRWRYTASMPLLPGLGIGLSPVLQMLFLPPIAFRLTACLLKRGQVARG